MAPVTPCFASATGVSLHAGKGKDEDMSSDPNVSRNGPPRVASTRPGPPASPTPPTWTPAAPPPPPTVPPAPPAAPRESAVKFTRAAALWSALIVGFLILIVLLVFIAQNTNSARFSFFGWHWSLPLGVAILLAAVCGGLITVLAGTVRIYQLRRAAKKNFNAPGPAV
jgi:uncharacterized integral membrane protein